MKDKIKLSNGTILKLDGWDYNSGELRTQDGGYTLTNESIYYSVWVTKPNGIQFSISFDDVPIHLKDMLLAHSVSELCDIVPLQCPECKHNL